MWIIVNENSEILEISGFFAQKHFLGFEFQFEEYNQT